MLGLGLFIANNVQTTDCIIMINPNVELGSFITNRVQIKANKDQTHAIIPCIVRIEPT